MLLRTGRMARAMGVVSDGSLGTISPSTLTAVASGRGKIRPEGAETYIIPAKSLLGHTPRTNVVNIWVSSVPVIARIVI
jgi:hypothetical protein